MTNSVGAAAAGLSAGYGTGDLIFYANSSGVMRFYNGSTCKVAIGADRIYADLIQSFSGTTFTMPADVTFGGVPSIRMAGAGVNWYMNSAQAGYWDTGPTGTGWRMNANNQLSLGGGLYYVNIKTPAQYDARPADWGGGCLFTTNYQSSSRAAGLNVGYYETGGYGCIICLQPSVVWRDLYLSTANIYAYSFGAYAAILTPGGWTNVSDEREKTNIKPLKTTRSLERVLAAKTFTYNRLFYLDSSGNDLVPQEEKDRNHVGVVAQQVKESNPHCISKLKGEKPDSEERFGVNYNDYVVHLLGAVQEQQKMIDQLVTHVTNLTNQVNELTKQIKK